MIVTFLFIILVSCAIAHISKVEFVDAAPVTLMVIMIALYVAYCLDLLNIGFKVILGIGLLIIIIMILSCVKKREYSGFCRIIKPSFIVWLLTCFFVIYITRNEMVSLWDEFRLWGAYPKILFYTNHIQLGADSLLFDNMKSNVPGMPLLCYFFERIQNIGNNAADFKESILFATYGVFSVTILSSCLEKEKKKWIIPVCVFVIYYLPKVFYNPRYDDYQIFYQSLFVDSILGLLLGYLAYQLFCGAYDSRFRIIRFTLTCITITLVKESGIAFAIVMSVVGLISQVLINKNRSKKNIVIHSMPVAFSVFSFLSWFFLCKIYNVESMVSFSNAPLFDIDFIKTFISHLFFNKFADCQFSRFIPHYSFAFVYAFITIIGVMFYRKMEGDDKRNFLLSFISMHICSIAFIIGLYYTYLRGYGKKIASFQRYMGTLAAGWLVMLTMIIIAKNSGIIKKIVTKDKYVISLVVLILISIIPWKSNIGYDPATSWGWIDHVNKDYEKIVANLRDVGKEYRGNNIYLYVDGWEQGSAWVHHRLYFDFIGSGYTIRNYYNEATITSSSNEEFEDKKNKFVNALKTGDYDYLICEGYNNDEGLLSKEQYSFLLGDNIHSSSIWRVYKEMDELSFEQLR